MTTTDLDPLLLDQIEHHRHGQLRPRLDGLGDEEYFWEPVPDCWSAAAARHRGPRLSRPAAARSRSTRVPEPEPAPVTTIAWRLAHIVVGVLAMRNAGHFGRPATDYTAFEYAGTAGQASPSSTRSTHAGPRGSGASAPTGCASRAGPPRGRGRRRRWRRSCCTSTAS